MKNYTFFGRKYLYINLIMLFEILFKTAKYRIINID